MKKGFLTLAAIAAIFSATNASTPKGETNSSKSESTVKSKDDLHTYYVIAQSTVNDTYTLSTSPAPQCGFGTAYPCEIQSTEVMPVSPSTVIKSDVEDNDEVTIINKRNF